MAHPANEPNLTMMQESMARIREISEAALSTAKEDGVDGAINWGDLSVTEVRFCIDEQGDASFDVLIEEAAPGCEGIILHVHKALDQLGLVWPIEVRTEW